MGDTEGVAEAGGWVCMRAGCLFGFFLGVFPSILLARVQQ